MKNILFRWALAACLVGGVVATLSALMPGENSPVNSSVAVSASSSDIAFAQQKEQLELLRLLLGKGQALNVPQSVQGIEGQGYLSLQPESERLKAFQKILEIQNLKAQIEMQEKLNKQLFPEKKKETIWSESLGLLKPTFKYVVAGGVALVVFSVFGVSFYYVAKYFLQELSALVLSDATRAAQALANMNPVKVTSDVLANIDPVNVTSNILQVFWAGLKSYIP